MKKITLLSLMILAITLVNCKKDKKSSDNQQNTPKPVPVTINTVDNSSRPANFTLKNLVKTIHETIDQTQMKSSLQTSSTTNYEYDTGRVLTKSTRTSGSDVYVDEYYYKDKTKGLLDSIVSKYNNTFSGVQIYTISNDKVQQIVKYDQNRQITDQITFTQYNGDKVSTFVMNSNGTTYNGTLIYSGDNISNFELDVPGILSMSVDYTYDDKKNPMTNVKTIASPITVANNVLTAVNHITYQGSTQNATVTYNYNYNNDNYPIQSTENANGNISKTEEYIYEDKN